MNLVHARTQAPALQRLRRWWRMQSLRRRLVAMSMALLLLVQVASTLVIHQGIQTNARRLLAQRLNQGAVVWQRLMDQRAATLQQGAALLAADYGFREAVASHDQATLRSALDNHRQRIHAAQAALLDTRLNLVATNDTMGDALSAALKRLAPQLAKAPGSGVVGLVDGRAVQFVMVPMRAPVLVGWVVMGFPLDRAVLVEMTSDSGLAAAVLAQPQAAEPRLVVSSLDDGTDSSPLVRQLADGELTLGRQQWLVQTLPLASGAEGRLTLRLAGSLDAAVAPYRGLQLLLALITALGLVLFGIGSDRLALHITQPLRRLVMATEQLGRGDYELPLQYTGSGGEVDDLASAFDQMRLGIRDQQREIRALAYTDRLTGLPNRLQFRESVQAAMAAALATGRGAASAATDAAAPERGDAGQAAPLAQQALAAAAALPLTVLMLDIDRFKHVNDVLGYAFGDRLLQAVAQRLQQAARPGDLVARLGGDEFALLMPGSDAQQGMALAQRIASAFEQPMQLDDHLVDLSAGIGIASWPVHASDTDVLLSRAEVAMYAAKRQTAGAQVYDPSVDTTSAQTLSLLSELRRALEHHELRLFLQPKVMVADGRAHAAEALVRWQHPQRGLVPPMSFIPFAEQTGFIRQLTLWMVEEVARQQARLAALGVACVSVNLSTRDLLDTELPAKLDAILLRHGAQPTGFCLEITESAIMDDPQRAQATLHRLAERGFKLSIDDFGTGYSSLAYLKRLPVHELKIDKSFVMKMEANEDDAKLVKLVIDLAHNLNLSVVAEGVENAAILTRLHELQCDEAQGYHLSRPLPLPQFIDWVSRWQPATAAQGLAGGA